MFDLAGKHESYWLDTAPHTDYSALSGDTEVEVAVVGGGIVGLAAAEMLTRAGKRVAVLEARRITEQVTGRTTAKLTALHGLIYDHLIRHFGLDAARLYAQANQTAIETIANWIQEHHIDCDFERQPAYTFTAAASRVDDIRHEVEAAKKLGLPVQFVTEAPIPLPLAGAIRMDNQAQFHPRKFLIALAAKAVAGGCRIFEHTRVIDVHGENPIRISTDRGNVTARDVIVATHLPILDRGAHFARAFPLAHVALTACIDEAQLPGGMFIMMGEQSYSFRRVNDPSGPLLMAIGPAFKPGHGSVAEKYTQLAAFVREHFGMRSFEHRWFNQDYYAADRVPYVGKLAPTSDHLYVATGFGGWGLTNGVAAATVLTGAITGRTHPWSTLYKSSRLKLRETAGKLLQENAHVARKWVRDHLTQPRQENLEQLPTGEGVVAKLNGEKVAAYRDDNGKLHTVSALCTHLGCVVQWNDAERSWDCPCHGSRFAVDGAVLQGPAVHPLESKPPQNASAKT